MRLLLFSFLLSLYSFFGFCQDSLNLRNFNYAKADSIALNFPKRNYINHKELSLALTKNLRTEHEKFRVIFRWITDNISYKVGSRAFDADAVLKSKTSVCEGYANLLRDMCIASSLECEVVGGYTKRFIKEIGTNLKEASHAWNAVKLNNKWYLADVTWAAGYTRTNRKYFKEYDELYFITHPEIFIINHFPEDKKWQLLKDAVKKSAFIGYPIFYPQFYKNEMNNLNNYAGSIKLKKGKEFEYKFTTNKIISSASIEIGSSFYYPKPQIISKNEYLIKQKFKEVGDLDLLIYLNEEAVAGYKISIK